MKRAICIALALACAAPVFAEPVVALRLTGRGDNRINVVIMGDGFTSSSSDQSAFTGEADTLVNTIVAQEPFKEYASFFNFYRVDLTSNQSGVSHLEWQQMKDTALGTYYGCGGVQRLICVDQALVVNVLSRSALPPDIDLVLIIVNDYWPGGAGGRFALVNRGGGAAETMLHEMGHTLGLLADEYDEPLPGACRATEPTYANATRTIVRDAIKWRRWIEPQTMLPTTILGNGIVGAYPSSAHCMEYHRPTYRSKMRWSGAPFEQINAEQLVKRFYNFVSPIDAVIPASRDQRIARGRPASFAVEIPQPATHDLTATWTIDGRESGTGTSVTLDTATLAPGRYTIEVRVSDSSTFVRDDPGEALVETFRWVLEITP